MIKILVIIAIIAGGVAGHVIPTSSYVTDPASQNKPTVKRFRFIFGGQAKYEEAINNTHCGVSAGCGDFAYKLYLW